MVRFVPQGKPLNTNNEHVNACAQNTNNISPIWRCTADEKKTVQTKTDDTTSDNIIVVKSERDNPEMRRKYIGSVAYAELVNGGG